MSNNLKNNPVTISEQEILYLDKMLKNINSDISIGMSYVKRIQGLTFDELQQRFTGINADTLKRYMQPSYPSMRPIHVVAAYSWVMMVPVTSFYYGFRMKEFYRGMDDNAVEALLWIGKLPYNQFNLVLEIIFNLFSKDQRTKFELFRKEIEEQYGIGDDYNNLFPPQILDINKFSFDYYRSVAITVKRFRLEYNIPIDTIARVLGLSRYQYKILEDENKNIPFSISIGARVKLGFQLNSHVNFTNEMKIFPEFHQLRKNQQIRDMLIVEALRQLDTKSKKHILKLIIELSSIYK